MKITANRAALLAAVKLAADACPAISTKPVLQMILIDATDATVSLAANDGEVGIKTSLDDKTTSVHHPGRVIIAPGKLAGLLRELPDENVEIEDTPAGTKLTAAGVSFTFPGGDPSSHPGVEGIGANPACRHEITAGHLRAMLRRVLFLAEKNPTVVRFTTSGALWEVFGGKLTLVSTDTKRLAVAEGPVTTEGEAADDGKGNKKTVPNPIVPRKALEILKIAMPADDSVAVRFAITDQDAVLEFNGTTVRGRLLAGAFPPWRSIVPKSAAAKFKLDRAEFLRTVRQASSMTDDESLRVSLEFANGQISAKANSERDETSGEVLSKTLEGEGDFSAAFNHKYLIEYLRSEDSPEIILEANDGNKPVVFRASERSMCVVMPLTE